MLKINVPIHQCYCAWGAVIKEDVPFCFFKTPMYGYIVDVYCIPEKRRNGYSSKIIEELLQWLKIKGVHMFIESTF